MGALVRVDLPCALGCVSAWGKQAEDVSSEPAAHEPGTGGARLEQPLDGRLDGRCGDLVLVAQACVGSVQQASHRG